MKARSMVCLAVVVCVGAQVVMAEDAIAPKEEIVLFNGKDFTGWEFCVRGKNEAGDTFKVEDGIIKCSGKPAGYMRTAKSYKDYKLTIEWRFTVKKGNSGVLVHTSKPDKVWPKSIECQGMFNNQGDFFVIGGTEFKEHKGKKGRRVAKNGPSNEKPLGEWNTYEIICKGDSVLPHVNGKLMNTATECSVTEGMICIQSEGVPWECRKITLAPAE